MGHPQIRADALQRAEPGLCGRAVATAQRSAAMGCVWVSQRYAEWPRGTRGQIIGRPIVDVTGAERNAGMA